MNNTIAAPVDASKPRPVRRRPSNNMLAATAAVLTILIVIAIGVITLIHISSDKKALATGTSRITNPDVAIAFRVTPGPQSAFSVDEVVTTVWPLADSGIAIANPQAATSVVDNSYLQVRLLGFNQGPIEASLVKGSTVTPVKVLQERTSPGTLPRYLVSLNSTTADAGTTLIVWMANGMQTRAAAGSGAGNPQLRGNPAAIMKLVTDRKNAGYTGMAVPPAKS